MPQHLTYQPYPGAIPKGLEGFGRFWDAGAQRPMYYRNITGKGEYWFRPANGDVAESPLTIMDTEAYLGVLTNEVEHQEKPIDGNSAALKAIAGGTVDATSSQLDQLLRQRATLVDGTTFVLPVCILVVGLIAAVGLWIIGRKIGG